MHRRRRDQLLTVEAAKLDLLRQVLAREGDAWVTCVGSSMEPTIPVGSRLRVAPAGRARAGDVVLFQARAGLVTHRVLARIPAPGGALLVHAGDAAPHRPALVREHRVIGRVAAPPRRIGVRAQVLALLRLARTTML